LECCHDTLLSFPAFAPEAGLHGGISNLKQMQSEKLQEYCHYVIMSSKRTKEHSAPLASELAIAQP
jgi:hypothetical protein